MELQSKCCSSTKELFVGADFHSFTWMSNSCVLVCDARRPVVPKIEVDLSETACGIEYCVRSGL